VSNLGLAANQLGANRQFQAAGAGNYANLGQQKYGNLAGVSNAQQGRLDQAALMDFQNRQRQFANPLAQIQAYGQLFGQQAQAFGTRTGNRIVDQTGHTVGTSTGTQTDPVQGGGFMGALGAGLTALGGQGSSFVYNNQPVPSTGAVPNAAQIVRRG